MPLDFPSSPTNGQVYGNYTYNSSKTAWIVTPVSSRVVTTSDTAPVSPSNGDMWMYTIDGTCFIYYNDGTSGQWVEQSKNTASSSTYQSPNYIINGALDHWQRATSASQSSNTTGYPSADRFKVYSSGATAPALTLARSADIPTGVPVQYSGAWSWSASTSTGDVIIGQIIENGKYLFAGQTVTVSFYAKAASAITVGSFFDQDYGSNPQNITTSWVRYSYTISLPTTLQSSRPSGSSANDHVELRFLRLTSTSSAANTIYFTGLQVEIGSVPTPFRRSAPNIQGELAACQRYFYAAPASYYTVSNPYYGVALTSGNILPMHPLPVSMRGTGGSTTIPFTFLSSTAGATLSRNLVLFSTSANNVLWNYNNANNASATLTAGYLIGQNTNDLWFSSEL